LFFRLSAEPCRSQAQHTSDPALKRDLLDMERRWLSMARSYEFTEQLSDFMDEVARRLPVGQPSSGARLPGGVCEVTKELPENNGEFEYRIKSAIEPHEPVARESDMTKA
jgi:hypothetical protein